VERFPLFPKSVRVCKYPDAKLGTDLFWGRSNKCIDVKPDPADFPYLAYFMSNLVVISTASIPGKLALSVQHTFLECWPI
jgi:hypothetical protein